MWEFCLKGPKPKIHALKTPYLPRTLNAVLTPFIEKS